ANVREARLDAETRSASFRALAAAVLAWPASSTSRLWRREPSTAVAESATGGDAVPVAAGVGTICGAALSGSVGETGVAATVACGPDGWPGGTDRSSHRTAPSPKAARPAVLTMARRQ